MLNKALLAATAALIAFSAPAFAADTDTYSATTKVEKDSNGNYYEKDKTSEKDANGMKTTAEKKVDVDVDSKGNRDKTVTTAKTQKTGWFGGDSVKTKDTEKENVNGTVETTHKKVVNGTTVENNSHTNAQ